MNQAPLHGLLAIELCQSVAGPYVGMLLGDLGCRVIKIERPGTGDDTRQWGPPFWNDESPTFLALNRNKESVVLDLKSDAGRVALQRLAQRADILIQNYRPGVLEAMGFGYEALAERNPGLIYCSISAFGGTGPLKDLPGYDPLVQAFSGIMSITGEPGRLPVRSGASIIDQGSGLWATLGILSALYQRRETGRGQLVETSLLETGLAWVPYQVVGYLSSGQDPRPHGSGLSMIAPYQAYETGDGSLMIAAGNDNLWLRLCSALGHPEWAEDRRFATNPDRVINREELGRLITDVLKTHASSFWETQIQRFGVPCSPLHRISEAVNHPQTAALGMIQPLPHPVVPDLRVVGNPLRLGGRRPRLQKAPPLLGSDTAAVIQELGLAGAERVESSNRGG